MPKFFLFRLHWLGIIIDQVGDFAGERVQNRPDGKVAQETGERNRQRTEIERTKRFRQRTRFRLEHTLATWWKGKLRIRFIPNVCRRQVEGICFCLAVGREGSPILQRRRDGFGGQVRAAEKCWPSHVMSKTTSICNFANGDGDGSRYFSHQRHSVRQSKSDSKMG